jgi:hypothetical protein
MNWQVHVYGACGAELRDWCAAHDISLHVFEWRAEHEAAGLARDATYLLRPDTYVALAGTAVTSDTLARYFADQGIQPGGPAA